MKRSCIMGIATSFLLLFSFSVKAEFKVVGYLYNWSSFVSNAKNIDSTKVTHVNIAFLNPDNNGNLSPTTSLSSVVTIIHNKNLKVLASLGGAGSPSSWGALMDVDQRDAFITKIINLVNTYNFDGIDIDLEGSAIDGNYNDFVLALKAAMPVGKLLTAAVATSNGWDIYDETLAAYDFINIMSYDYCGTWSTSACPHSPYSSAETDIHYWKITRKLSQDKVILGLPSYGYSWETGGNALLSYKQIVGSYARAANQDSIHTNSGGVIYHNGIPTIKQKTTYAMDNAGGVMWWALPMDYPSSDSRSLMRAMGEITITAIATVEEKQNILLYPNPSSTDITLNFSTTQSGTATIKLFDISGKKVGELYNGHLTTGDFSQTFAVNFLAPGIYTCVISTNENVAVMKLIRE